MPHSVFHLFISEIPRCRDVGYSSLLGQIYLTTSSNRAYAEQAFNGSRKGQGWQANKTDISPVFRVDLRGGLIIVLLEFSVKMGGVNLTMITDGNAKANVPVSDDIMIDIAIKYDIDKREAKQASHYTIFSLQNMTAIVHKSSLRLEAYSKQKRYRLKTVS